MDYLRKAHMVCFSVDELENLQKWSMTANLAVVLSELGYTLEDLRGDPSKMEQTMNRALSKNAKYKEDIEIFLALNSCTSFYKMGSKICFVLKDSTNLQKDKINTLDDLKSFTKENELTDFAIMSVDGLRQFQLKQYQNELVTESLFNFIKKVLFKYGNNLGDVNLLIILQGLKSDTTEIKQMKVDFHELHNKIQGLNLTFTGQIMIEYNEQNKYSILNQVFPELKSMKKEIDHDFLDGRDISTENE